MNAATAFLIIIWNASSWTAPGERQYEYADMDACSRALANLKIAPTNGVAVVAFCSPKAKDKGRP